MKITAKVYKREYAGAPSLRATANITIEDCFVVKGINVMEGKNGLFISMPSKKNTNGEYKDICFPINTETRQQIVDEIMKEYNNIDDKIKTDEDLDLPF